ncbi:hypothetical protein PTSG_06838 [Salpingoeca rosetta]|uniref:Uncharacterized protein n=1 Tax=Salpingoeca rosetta (strain ATCC 50818 / BSB-021) TaxID=946362 RepID=F2UEY5_SALR5|nr:uncharacterized protein PTSG_06838 [Salpingoeca rosetta]EGD75185.1 hypothetical protein PTSG_06838 [Salpingoeca rosetta]|eukprot:XP_004992238.1 hypothetical protein PTSG_06838 [Salpingoeca rosetta]
MMLSATSTRWTGSGRLSHRMDTRSRLNLSGIDDATKTAPWYLGEAVHRQAVIALNGLHTGAFVVRASHSIPGAHILSFIDNNGQIRNEVIKLGSRGLRLKRSKVAFPFMSELIAFYSDEANHSVSTLPCVLKPAAISSARKDAALATSDVDDDDFGHAAMPGKLPTPTSQQQQQQQQQASLLQEYGESDDLQAFLSHEQSKRLPHPQQQQQQQHLKAGHGRGRGGGGGDVSGRRTPSAPHAGTAIRSDDGKVLYVFDVIAPVRRATEPELASSKGKWPTPPHLKKAATSTSFAHMTSLDLIEDDDERRALDALRSRPTRAVPSLTHQHWIDDNITNWVFDEPIAEWTARDVQEWLHSIDCKEASRAFKRRGIDGQAFSTMTPHDIQALGISRDQSEEIYNHMQALIVQPDLLASQFSVPGELSRTSSRSSVAPARGSKRAPAAPVVTWDKFAVRMWLLYDAGYDNHLASIFLRMDIDGPALLAMTDSSLRDLGIEHANDRAAILDSIAELAMRDQMRVYSASRPANIRKWSSSHVAAFLEEKGFGAYVPAFREQHVMGAALAAMNHDALAALGVTEPAKRDRLLALVQLQLQKSSSGGAFPFYDQADAGMVSDRPVPEWSAADVERWLKQNNLQSVASSFTANDIDGQTLLQMSRDDMRRMGVRKENDLLRLAEKIEQLRAELRVLADRPGRMTAEEQDSLAQYVADVVASRLQLSRSGDGDGDGDGRAFGAHAYDDSDDDDDIFWEPETVVLVKDPDEPGFGFRIGGGPGHDGRDQPTIINITQHSPADGRLKVGDVLMAANGRSLEDGDVSDVKRLISRARDQLTLQVLRPSRLPRRVRHLQRSSSRGSRYSDMTAATTRTATTHKATPVPSASQSRARVFTATGSGSGVFLDRHDDDDASEGDFRFHQRSAATSAGDDGMGGGDMDGVGERGQADLVSSFYRTAAALQGTAYGADEMVLDEAAEFGAASDTMNGYADGADGAGVGAGAGSLRHQLTEDGEEAVDVAEYTLANDTSGSAPRPAVGLRSVTHQFNPTRTPAHARAGTLLSNRSSTVGDAAFASSAAAHTYAAVDETPEFVRRRSTLRRTGNLNVGEAGEPATPDMESLVRRTDSLLTQQSSFDRSQRPRVRPNHLATPDKGLSLDVTLSPMSHANPLSWSVSKVSAFFQSENCPEVAKKCKKNKIAGASLLRTNPQDIVSMWEVADTAEAERAAQQVAALQEAFPCPLAARWSVADVGDWLDHNALGQLKRPFAKKKIDGVSLCLLRQGQLESLNVPPNLRHPLMSALAAVQHRTEPEETEAAQWSPPEVIDCLAHHNLYSPIPALQKKKMTGSQLLELTQASLYNMGVRNTDVQTALLHIVGRLREKQALSTHATPLLQPNKRGPAFWDSGSGLQEWSTRAVCDWLAYNGLGEHCRRFHDADVDGEQLAAITQQRLESLGVGPDMSGRVLDLVDIASARQAAASPTTVPRGMWTWSPEEVQMWLSSIGMGRHASAFADNGVDGAALVFATEADLIRHGVTEAGERRAVLDGVEAELVKNSYPLIFAATHWDQQQVESWLKRHEHDNLLLTMRHQGVDGDVLLHLKAVDLVKMGIPASAHDKLLTNIDHLRRVLMGVSPRPELPQEWSSITVAEWLADHNLGEFSQLCRDLHIGGHLFTRMTREDLNHLGVTSQEQQPAFFKAKASLRKNRRLSHTVSAGTDLTTPVKDTDNSKAADWTLTDVSKWLTRIRLGKYRALFQSHSISGPALLRLTPDDLDRMNIHDASHRSQLLTHVARLRRGALPAFDEEEEGEEGAQADASDATATSTTTTASTAAREHQRRGGSMSSTKSGVPGDDGVERAWFQPDVPAGRATLRLTSARLPNGSFLVHMASQPGSAYGLTVVSNGRVTQSSIVERDGRFALESAAEEFTSLDDLVAFYSNPPQLATSPLPYPLVPRGSDTRRRPISWQQRSVKRQERPTWDRRFVGGGCSPAQAQQQLAGQADGHFLVAMKEDGGDTPVLYVAYQGAVLSFEIHEAESETDGTIGYALEAQPDVVHRTMTELVGALRQQRGPLPVELHGSDVSDDIKHTITERKRAEEPWCWWQIDTPKAQAEALLSNKQTGAFVIYRHATEPSSFVLAYKVGNSVHRERIYHTPKTDLFNPGFHLAKAQHKVLSSLHRLVEHYTHSSGDLLCRLRVSIAPDTSLSVKPQSRASTRRAPRTLSWLHLQANVNPSDILGSRGRGAFIVTPSPKEGVAFQLAYKKDQAIVTRDIMAKSNGIFGGFFLSAAPKALFPTLQDLVIHHQDASHSLDCTLNVRQMCLLARPHTLAAADQHTGAAWAWCQVGVPRSEALKELKGKAAGAFVVYGLCDGDDGVHLTFGTADGDKLETVDVEVAPNGKCSLPVFDGVEGENLEHMLVTLLQHETHGAKFLWPTQPPTSRLRSPRIVRAPPTKEKPWNWWQLDADPEQALQELRLRRDGAFVIRRHPSGGALRFLLSYKFHDRIIDEEIIRTPASNMFSQGFMLGSAQQHVYPTLHALVNACTRPGQQLKCPLRVSIQPDPDLQPPAVTPTMRQKGRTYERLQAAVEGGQEATRKWRAHEQPPKDEGDGGDEGGKQGEDMSATADVAGKTPGTDQFEVFEA